MVSDSKPSATPRSSGADGRISRKYWMIVGAGLAAIALFGLSMLSTRFSSADEALRNRLVGKWNAPNTFSFDLRADGTCNVSFFGAMSFDGVWQVEDGHLCLDSTQAGNTFTHIYMAPVRWLGADDSFRVKQLVKFLDDDRFETVDGIAVRVK